MKLPADVRFGLVYAQLPSLVMVATSATMTREGGAGTAFFRNPGGSPDVTPHADKGANVDEVETPDRPAPSP